MTDDFAARGPRSAGRRWVLLGAGAAALLAYAAYTIAQPHAAGEFSYLGDDSLPFSAMFGFTREQLQSHVVRAVLLGPALVLLGLGLAGRLPALPGAVWAAANARRLGVVAALAAALFGAFVLFAVLRGRAITDDELTYRHQAGLLAEGRLGDPRLPKLGWEPFTIQSRAGQTGKYLFGEPLAQIPGTLAGAPALMHIAFSALTLIAWFAVVAAETSAGVAAWATLLLALSPMFLFTQATGLSHSTSLLCTVLAGLGLARCRSDRPVLGALLAGHAIGFGLAVRPQVLLPIGAVLAAGVAAALLRRRRFAACAIFAASVTAWLCVIGLYDRAVTGSAWSLPWTLYVPRESFGFDPPHSLARAFENLAVTAVRWNAWWLGLPVGLALFAVWFRLGRPRRGLAVWGACGLALAAFNFCYYSPGISDTGPVYYFELLLPASLLAAHTVVAALERWPAATASLLLVHLVLGTGSFLVEQGARLARLERAIYSRLDETLAGIELPALLLHEKEPAEATCAGWVLSFPLRHRSEREPLLTFPRHSPDEVAALRALWPERHCYYYRTDPTTHVAELRTCADAESFLSRKKPFGERPGWQPSPKP